MWNKSTLCLDSTKLYWLSWELARRAISQRKNKHCICWMHEFSFQRSYFCMSEMLFTSIWTYYFLNTTGRYSVPRKPFLPALIAKLHHPYVLRVWSLSGPYISARSHGQRKDHCGGQNILQGTLSANTITSQRETHQAGSLPGEMCRCVCALLWKMAGRPPSPTTTKSCWPFQQSFIFSDFVKLCWGFFSPSPGDYSCLF